jgi:hydroxyacylglutathione hydrolase
MAVQIVTLMLGPVQTNSYLVADSESGDAAVIDPAWDGHLILAEAEKHAWRIAHLWITHAHFDHIGAAGEVANALNPLPLVALHPADHTLWRAEGGAPLFGYRIDPGPEPTIDLTDGQVMRLGKAIFEVRYTPGHTPGSCSFYCPEAKVLFCGDLIFQGSVGRTDMPGGDWEALLNSIKTQVFSLPDETLLLSGHGPGTTVGDEKKLNPFVAGL